MDLGRWILNGHNNFPLGHLLPIDMKHAISTRLLTNPNEDNSHFPHNLRSLYEHHAHFQSEDSRAHEMVIYIGPPSLC